MNFKDFPYERPNMEQLEQQFNALLSQFHQAANAGEQERILSDINALRSKFDSMANLAEIRHTVDTNDEFYKTEQEFLDEVKPQYQKLVTPFYEALVSSPYKNELQAKFGEQLFALAEASLKTFKPEILEDLQTENKLASEYQRVIASAKVQFDGKELTLPQLGPYMQSADRETRKKANEARYSFFAENEAKLDEIYDKLVKVRVEIAKKLGFDSFIELAYARMSRTDYDASMVEQFRKQVLEEIVPVASRLKESQRVRIGLDELNYYDESFHFKTGNPDPKGDPQWIVEQGRKMYAELSPETDEFFRYMDDNGLMDLFSRPGKAAGGYCAYLSEFSSPFIFANCNGTAYDIRVLTHEAGHAYQVYSSSKLDVPEYFWPTMEAAEIHSMSMEYITYPWMELFFEENADKYRYYNLVAGLTFIPYGVAVDEFQHWVFSNPAATPAERKAEWRAIERKYLPHRSYEGNDYLERGGYWHQQGHVFQSPFYYIDYTLAQICAFQFWKQHSEQPADAWERYNALCKLGGSKPFTELVRVAGLDSPFEAGTVASVIGHIEGWLNGVDDMNM